MSFHQEILTLALVVAGMAAPASASQAKPDEPPDSHLIQQLLQRPDHRDFPCKVKLSSPILTFQQRYLVGISTIIPRQKLMKDVSSRDLHYVVKVADESGRWFNGQSHEHFVVPPGTSGKIEIASYAETLFRPGGYTIALLIYDDATQQSVVWRKHFTVHPLKNDPLPLADRNIPTVEFPPNSNPFPDQKEPGDRPHLRFDPGYVNPSYMQGAWTFSVHPLRLPVENPRPVLLDVLVNLAPGNSLGSSVRAYAWNANLILQVGSTLAGLQMKAGCTRLTAVDVLRQNILLDRRDPGTLDWADVRQSIADVNYARIDVQTLANRKHSAVFLRDILSRFLEASAPCALPSDQYLHVTIVVSTGLIFPSGSEVPRLQIEDTARNLFYYIKPVVRASDLWDQIEEILRPAKPVVFKVRGALQFRKTLARIIAGIEQHNRL